MQVNGSVVTDKNLETLRLHEDILLYPPRIRLQFKPTSLEAFNECLQSIVFDGVIPSYTFVQIELTTLTKPCSPPGINSRLNYV